MKYYLILCLSIIAEVIGAAYMKVSEGFSHLGSTMMVISFYGLALTLYIILSNKTELGIINTIWMGGATTLVTVIGIIAFNEAISLLKFIGVLSIIMGIIGLNLPKKEYVNQGEI